MPRHTFLVTKISREKCEIEKERAQDFEGSKVSMLIQVDTSKKYQMKSIVGSPRRVVADQVESLVSVDLSLSLSHSFFLSFHIFNSHNSKHTTPPVLAQFERTALGAPDASV